MITELLSTMALLACSRFDRCHHRVIHVLIESGLHHHVCSNRNVKNVFSVPFIRGLLKDGLHLRLTTCSHPWHTQSCPDLRCPLPETGQELLLSSRTYSLHTLTFLDGEAGALHVVLCAATHYVTLTCHGSPTCQKGVCPIELSWGSPESIKSCFPFPALYQWWVEYCQSILK